MNTILVRLLPICLLALIAGCSAPALHQAARKGDLASVKAIVEKGGNAKDDWGGFATPLHFAARGGNVAVAEYLLAQGSDVNAATRHGGDRTPLHEAAFSGKTEMVQFLLSKGANVKAVAVNGETPLHLTCGTFSSWLMTLVARRFSAEDKLLAEFEKTAELLIQAGADVDAVSVSPPPMTGDGYIPKYAGLSALHYAGFFNRPNLVSLLVKHGADINRRTLQDSYTPLHLAAIGGCTAAARALVAAGCDVQAKTPAGETALNLATLNNQEVFRKEISKLLIELNK